MTRPPPFRIGFWCAYRETLLPQTGIGVFAFELIDAILRNHPEVEVCVAYRAGDEPLLAEFAAKHPVAFGCSATNIRTPYGPRPALNATGNSPRATPASRVGRGAGSPDCARCEAGRGRPD